MPHSQSGTAPPGYLGLCYHYIRPARARDPFPRIRGTRVKRFRGHVRMLKEHYRPITLADARRFSYDSWPPPADRPGVLVTFDDGLADQYLAAQILHDMGVQAVFFIPTCIFVDRVPAKPTIVHYALAIDGVVKFLASVRHALEHHRLPVDPYMREFDPAGAELWTTIGQIKALFKYRLGYANARRVLVHIYEESLRVRYPDLLEVMHLTAAQITDMLAMGHAIGAHTRSHFSVAASDLSDELFTREMIEPRDYLEHTFHTPVWSLSYPFGGARDSLEPDDLLRRTTAYTLAYTVQRIANTKAVSPLMLGRYSVHSTDDDQALRRKLAAIARGEGDTV